MNSQPGACEHAPYGLDPSQLARIRTDTFVRAVEWHEEISSTSDQAIELASRDNVELPLLVLSGRQTAGRGRGVNRWWAAPGALTFSLLLEPDPARLPAQRWPQISLAAALAVGELLTKLVPAADVKLKWPNDVYLAGRKVCGILVESPAAASGRVIVGLGLNVNNALAAAPDDIRQTAVALCELAGRPFPLIDVLLPLLRGIESQLNQLTAADPRLAQRWESFCLLRDRRVEIQEHDRAVTGLCQGIDSFGALVVSTPTGIRRILSGTVARID